MLSRWHREFAGPDKNSAPLSFRDGAMPAPILERIRRGNEFGARNAEPVKERDQIRRGGDRAIAPLADFAKEPELLRFRELCRDLLRARFFPRNRHALFR